MTRVEKIEIGVNKIKAIPFLTIMIALVMLPPYFVYFTDKLSDTPILKFTCLPVATYLAYYTYRLLIARLFLGPIITLTHDKLIVKNEDKVHNYHWTEIRTVKVEVVVTKNSNAQSTEQTCLTIWSTTKKDPDVFYISDLEMSGDEIRSLINEYR